MLSERATEPEILDVEDPPPEEVARVHRFIGFMNRWFGGRRALLARFAELAEGWEEGGAIRVLDVGVGAADLPGVLRRWAGERGVDLRVVGLDIDPSVLRYARREEPDLAYVQGDVHDLPFRAGAVDYVMTSLFLHHLTDEGIVEVLRAFDRIARRGIVCLDLRRNLRAWLWAEVITFFGGRIPWHDGPLSVRKAFTADELEGLARRAGLDWLETRIHFGHRLTLAGERPGR